ncbi:MAG: RNA polymerase factor sigma-54, partial [Candidatus Omnitrophica bacterium]|nr:RNA polymerase factor sigma-54 [Candidatus Omnitrophota bacterium]
QAEINPVLNITPPLEQKEKPEGNSTIENDKEFELDFSRFDRLPLTQENYNFDDEERQRYRESLITAPSTLHEHLLRQLRLFTSAEDERKIGEQIIENFDDNGYLLYPIEEIAKSARAEPSQVKKVLFLIQNFEPIGVGARNLRECLLLQIKARSEENSLAGKIIDKYLPYLEKRKYSYIARKLSTKDEKVSVEKIKKAGETIANLDPKPGRSFNTERTVWLIPEAALSKNKQGYEIIFNDDELPHVIINAKYKQMLKQKDTPEDVKEYLRERLKAAHSLINAVRKRKETIRKIIEEITVVQKDFLDNGGPHFKPLTLEEIAKRIGKHKSTVSRAIAHKYIHTPWGIFELRYFLSSGIRQKNGVCISSKTIKLKMKDFIENESKGKPLTDRKIGDHLKREGISIARRTITKYRQQLKILPSKLRQE